jgi:hypothetical protein
MVDQVQQLREVTNLVVENRGRIRQLETLSNTSTTGAWPGFGGTPGTIEPDDAAAQGAGAFAARVDHQHAIAAAAPSDPSVDLNASTEGVSTSFARADHTHQLDRTIDIVWTGQHVWESDGCYFEYGIEINSTQRDSDTVISSQGNANMFVVDAGDDNVTVGGTAPHTWTVFSIKDAQNPASALITEYTNVVVGNLTAADVGNMDWTVHKDAGGDPSYEWSVNSRLNPADATRPQRDASFYSLIFAAEVSTTLGQYDFYSQPPGGAIGSIFHIGSNFIASNPGGLDIDTYIETANLGDAVYVNAGDDFVGFGIQTSPSTDDQVAHGTEDDFLNFSWYNWDTTPVVGLTGYVADGTESSPGQTPSGSGVYVGMRGYEAVVGSYTLTRAYISFIAQEAFTNVAQGAQVEIHATPATTTNRWEQMTFYGGEIVVNEDSNDIDYRVETNTLTHAIFTDGAEDLVMFNLATEPTIFPAEMFHIIYWDQNHATHGYRYPFGLIADGSNCIFFSVGFHPSGGAGAGSGWVAQSSRGSYGTPSAVQSGDRLGFMIFGGYDGADFENTVGFEAFANENFGVANEGSHLQFVATAQGTTSRTTVMRLYGEGHMSQFGGTSFPTANLNDNDLFYRTDLDMLCFYDSSNTQWLTVQEFAIYMSHFLNRTAAGRRGDRRKLRTDYNPYFTRIAAKSRVATPNDGSNNWDVEIRAYNLTEAASTLVYSWNTAADALVWVDHGGAATTAQPANDDSLDLVNNIAAGAPGNLDVVVTVFFRLVIT